MACVSERMVMRSMQVLTGISVRCFSRRWSGAASGAGLSERGFGGISGMGWDSWPDAGLGWGSRVGRQGRHKVCPYGSGSEDDGGDAGATRGQAQGLPLREQFGG